MRFNVCPLMKSSFCDFLSCSTELLTKVKEYGFFFSNYYFKF